MGSGCTPTRCTIRLDYAESNPWESNGAELRERQNSNTGSRAIGDKRDARATAEGLSAQGWNKERRAPDTFQCAA